MQKRAADAEIKWQEEISIKNTEIATKDKAIKDKDSKINLVEQEIMCLQEQKQQVKQFFIILRVIITLKNTISMPL